nr:hypothetical protein CFP56_12062 [Quercus suber]
MCYETATYCPAARETSAHRRISGWEEKEQLPCWSAAGKPHHELFGSRHGTWTARSRSLTPNVAILDSDVTGSLAVLFSASDTIDDERMQDSTVHVPSAGRVLYTPRSRIRQCHVILHAARPPAVIRRVQQ